MSGREFALGTFPANGHVIAPRRDGVLSAAESDFKICQTFPSAMLQLQYPKCTSMKMAGASSRVIIAKTGGDFAEFPHLTRIQ
jgi:hypothetical protein